MRRVMLIAGLVICSAVLCGGVWADRKSRPPARPSIEVAHLAPVEVAPLAPVEDLPLAAGRVVAVDGDKNKIVIEHGAIDRYELPAMTRVFHVEDRHLLAGLTPGDKIRFNIHRDGKRYVITRIENSN